MLETYFENYREKYRQMKKALKEFIDAKADFYTLTGMNYDAMPKSKKIPSGFDKLLASIETLEEDYFLKKEDLEKEKEKCKKDIEKINNTLYADIVEYVFLNFEDNKTLAESLKRYHNKDFSLGYVKILKIKAINKFKKVITKYNQI